MTLHFETLIPQIDRIISLLKWQYRQAPGTILTENDLKWLLCMKLSQMPALRKPLPTRDRHVLGCSVHAELSWFDENRKLRIIPDITIIEPGYLRILRGYSRPAFDPFSSPFGGFRRTSRLPSKQYEIDGKAITFELKFTREGVNDRMLKLIEQDYRKMKRLFEIMDRRGEGHTLFSYLVIFDKHYPRHISEPLAEFLRENGAGPRHKIVYITGRLRPPRTSVWPSILFDRCKKSDQVHRAAKSRS